MSSKSLYQTSYNGALSPSKPGSGAACCKEIHTSTTPANGPLVSACSLLGVKNTRSHANPSPVPPRDLVLDR
eukprot:3093957-Amphidinium_carterae.1